MTTKQKQILRSEYKKLVRKMQNETIHLQRIKSKLVPVRLGSNLVSIRHF